MRWAELRAAGFAGVVFDKDNTLTLPYATGVHAPLAAALAAALAAFGPRGVAILSNSAGLRQYDPAGAAAEALERELGVPVLRHSEWGGRGGGGGVRGA